MAYEFYVTIEGTKQGKFKGNSVREKWKGKITGLSFHYEVKSPREAGSGLATGKRQHQPVTFVKQWAASSPQIFQALVTNEVLKTVLFEFVETDNNGEEMVFYTIKLLNASITNFRPFINRPDTDTSSYSTTGLEEVSCTFQRIEIEHKAGKTMASDDWKSI
jgi:type VI secretion system secreted protein Hcp